MWRVATEPELHDKVLEFFGGDFFGGKVELGLVGGNGTRWRGRGVGGVEGFGVEVVEPLAFREFVVGGAGAFAGGEGAG